MMATRSSSGYYSLMPADEESHLGSLPEPEPREAAAAAGHGLADRDPPPGGVLLPQERRRPRVVTVQCTPNCTLALQQQLGAAAGALAWRCARPPTGRQQSSAVAPYLAASVVWHEGERGALTSHCAAHQLLPHQWLSRIIGLGVLTEKDAWERLLRHERGSDYAQQTILSPHTLLLPEEEAQLPGLAEDGTYIAKPSQGSQGSGIVLLRGCREVNNWWAKHREHSQCPEDMRYVLQAYLEEPLTLRGHKFDLRLYLVLRVDHDGHWEAYLYKEGMVRLCSLPYAALPARTAAAQIGDTAGEAEEEHDGGCTREQEKARSQCDETALPSDWRLAHLSNTSLKNFATGAESQSGRKGQAPPPSTELMWGGLLEDTIKAGVARTTGAGAHHSQSTSNGARQHEQQKGLASEHEDDHDSRLSRMATFWGELVAIAEVTARALRRGVTVGSKDSSHAVTIGASTPRGTPVGDARDGEATIVDPVRCGMFQVVGLDVMLDAAHRPWVLEVNARPALTGTELKMKQRLLRAILASLPVAAAPNDVAGGSANDSPPAATVPEEVLGTSANGDLNDSSLLRLGCFNERV